MDSSTGCDPGPEDKRAILQQGVTPLNVDEGCGHSGRPAGGGLKSPEHEEVLRSIRVLAAAGPRQGNATKKCVLTSPPPLSP